MPVLGSQLHGQVQRCCALTLPKEEATLTDHPCDHPCISHTFQNVLHVDFQMNPCPPALPPADLQVLSAHGQERLHPSPIPHKQPLPLSVQVEATKFTEVGFHGRDVDQIIRDLVDNAVTLMKQKQRAALQVWALLFVGALPACSNHAGNLNGRGPGRYAQHGWAVKQMSLVQQEHRVCRHEMMATGFAYPARLAALCKGKPD